MKIRAGDTVVITTGKDKGKTGQVLRVLQAKNRIVVTDANMRTRHIKGNPNRPGEIVKYEASIALSNVMIIDPKTKKRARVGYSRNAKGHKVRIAKQSGEEIKKGVIAKKKEAAAKDTEEKTVKKTVKPVRQAQDKKAAEKKESAAPAKDGSDAKSPFWKKMGFGAEDLAEGATLDSENKDHTVPDQTSSTNRSSQRGS